MTDFYRKTLRGDYDNDNGGRRVNGRAQRRARINEMLLLTEQLEADGRSGKILTEQDFQVVQELADRLKAVAGPCLRIAKQQSQSRRKRGEIEGNQR